MLYVIKHKIKQNNIIGIADSMLQILLKKNEMQV